MNVNGADGPSTENIYITGCVDALQNWSPDNALLLSSANYPTWSSASLFLPCVPPRSRCLTAAFAFVVTVTLPASTAIQYKYIRKFNGQVTWESDPNRSFTTPASGSTTRNDQWR